MVGRQPSWGISQQSVIHIIDNQKMIEEHGPLDNRYDGIWKHHDNGDGVPDTWGNNWGLGDWVSSLCIVVSADT